MSTPEENISDEGAAAESPAATEQDELQKALIVAETRANEARDQALRAKSGSAIAAHGRHHRRVVKAHVRRIAIEDADRGLGPQAGRRQQNRQREHEDEESI